VEARAAHRGKPSTRSLTPGSATCILRAGSDLLAARSCAGIDTTRTAGFMIRFAIKLYTRCVTLIKNETVET
jgi:hypothetical protein